MKKELSRWDLADLFPSAESDVFKNTFRELEEKVTAFEKFREDLTIEIDQRNLLNIITRLEEITKSLHKLGGFAELWFSEDTQNQQAQSLLAKIEQLSAELSNRVMFFTLWWKSLEDETAGRLMDGIGDYKIGRASCRERV